MAKIGMARNQSRLNTKPSLEPGAFTKQRPRFPVPPNGQRKSRQGARSCHPQDQVKRRSILLGKEQLHVPSEREAAVLTLYTVRLS